MRADSDHILTLLHIEPGRSLWTRWVVSTMFKLHSFPCKNHNKQLLKFNSIWISISRAKYKRTVCIGCKYNMQCVNTVNRKCEYGVWKSQVMQKSQVTSQRQVTWQDFCIKTPYPHIRTHSISNVEKYKQVIRNYKWKEMSFY